MGYKVSVHRIVRQRKGDNQYILKHSHPYFHYIYILNGKGRIIVDDYEIFVEKHDLIMNPPRIEHEIFGLNELICLDIKFSCDKKLTQKLNNIGYYIKEVSYYEDNLIRDIFQEAVASQKYFEHIINSKVLELIFYILRRKKDGIMMINTDLINNTFTQTISKVESKNIKDVLYYIEDNISESLTVNHLAAIMGYNESYFSTFFKQCVGYSPSKYINMAKINKGKELMLYTNKNITQISEKLGFKSVHYFSKVFKNIVGIPPIQYMNKTKVDMTIDIIKDSVYTPKTKYEIPMEDLPKK